MQHVQVGCVMAEAALDDQVRRYTHLLFCLVSRHGQLARPVQQIQKVVPAVSEYP